MPNHDISKCDLIHYLPDKLKIIKNEYYTKNSRSDNKRKRGKNKIWLNLIQLVQSALDYFSDNETIINNTSWVKNDLSFLEFIYIS